MPRAASGGKTRVQSADIRRHPPVGLRWQTRTLFVEIGTLAGSLLVDSGSTIYVGSGATSFADGITLKGSGNSEGRGAIRVAGATKILGCPILLAGSSTIGMENAAARITGNIRSGAEGTQILTLGGTQGSQAGDILSGNISGGTGTLNAPESGFVRLKVTPE